MSKICGPLHKLFNSMERFVFPFDEAILPSNGIYILFEKGEGAHGADRIVRVGTHTGIDQLRSRLKQHFINENKDRSIFRKNIGRAILNKNKDPFLEQWEWDLTTREAKNTLGKKVCCQRQKEIEKKVTKYIQNNFSFVVINIEKKEDRLGLESKIISTVSLCEECRPSDNWFGLYSTKDKIRESGLWLVNELYKEPLAEKEFIALKKICKAS